jgi:hypothetical protein
MEERLQKQVDMYSSGLDIIHGELKNMMFEAEEQFLLAQKSEDKSGEAMDSIERRYWEGYSDGLTAVYKLTYDLSFAIQERGSNG